MALAYSSAAASPMGPTDKFPAAKSPDTRVQDAEPLERGRCRLQHEEDERKARRKAQCKLNQRRYRARQRGLISKLLHETDELKGQLRDLRDYREFLRAYFVEPRTVWEDVRPVLVAKHFVRAFRAGFALHSTESSCLQESFVRLVCTPALVAQGATTDGIEALLLQLKRYTSYHGTLELRVQTVTVMHGPKQHEEDDCVEEQLVWVVQARGRLKLRISRDTLMLVYPHVMRHHNRLAQCVMGQTIEPEFTTTFYFDTQAKMTKLDQHVDFVGAFFRLLKSAEDVATLLEGALISPFSELGLDPQGGAAESALTRGCKQLSLKYILL